MRKSRIVKFILRHVLNIRAFYFAVLGIVAIITSPFATSGTHLILTGVLFILLAIDEIIFRN